MADRRDNGDREHEETVPGPRLYIGPLGDKTDRGELEAVFGKFGKVVEVTLKNGFAFLEYETADQAQEAIKMMHDTVLGGSTIKVEHVRSKRRRGEAAGPPKCFNCGQTGHWMKNCPDAKPWGSK